MNMESVGTLEIELKPEFREPLRTVGFVGRATELSRLTSIFERRSSGTLLVGGHRGVGKTALVDEALKRAKPENPPRIVARLTLPHVYRKGESASGLRDQILRSLARALYFALKDDDKVGDEELARAKELYSKTYLRELQSERVIESIVEAEAQERTLRKTETTIQVGRALSIALGTALVSAVGAGVVHVSSRVAADHGAAAGIVSAIAVLGVAIASALTLRKATEKEKTFSDKLMETSRASQVGTLDLSPETLEFELRQLVVQLAKSQRRCVFIIDELDKLDIERSAEEEDETAQEPPEDVPKSLPPPESHPIFSIVSGLKNFFTLGSGLFVFISGEDFFTSLDRSISGNVYSLAHTLFTDRLFVHVLHYQDVEGLVDGLVAKLPENSEDREFYRRFRNYLCWESRNHVFDLLNLVSEFVVFTDDGRPILRASEAGPEGGSWREGNLPEEWESAAGLQKFVGASYDESRRPSSREARFNQSLYLTLRGIAGALLGREQIEIPDKGRYELPSSPWVMNLSDLDLDDLAGAVERMILKMERYGAVQGTSRSEQDPSSGEETGTVTAYRLADPMPYPPASIATETERTSYEEVFLDIASRVDEMDRNLIANGVDTSTFQENLVSVRKLSEQVSDTSPRGTVARSRVRNGLRTANGLPQPLVSHGIESVLMGWAQPKEFSMSDDLGTAEPRSGTPWKATLEEEFAEFTAALEQSGIGYWIVGSSASENQVIILIDLGGEALDILADAYGKVLTGRKGRERRRQRLPIVAIVLATSEELPPIPEEVVELVEEDAPGWFARFLLGQRPKTREITQELAGWHVFSLDPNLSNLGELSSVVEQQSYLDVSSPDSSEDDS